MFGEGGAKTDTGGEWSKKMPGALTLPLRRKRRRRRRRRRCGQCLGTAQTSPRCPTAPSGKGMRSPLQWPRGPCPVEVSCVSPQSAGYYRRVAFGRQSSTASSAASPRTPALPPLDPACAIASPRGQNLLCRTSGWGGGRPTPATAWRGGHPHWKAHCSLDMSQVRAVRDFTAKTSAAFQLLKNWTLTIKIRCFGCSDAAN